jgi:hypothetical protein
MIGTLACRLKAIFRAGNKVHPPRKRNVKNRSAREKHKKFFGDLLFLPIGIFRLYGFLLIRLGQTLAVNFDFPSVPKKDVFTLGKYRQGTRICQYTAPLNK